MGTAPGRGHVLNRQRLPIVVVLGAALIGAPLLAFVLGSLGGETSHVGQFGHFDNARTVHLAPDGRLIVADLGTGRDDGRVVAVSLDGKQEVLMGQLPSTRHSGQAHSDLAGPSGAAMNEMGIACTVIGDGPTAEYATMRCTDGLRVDLKAFERTNNPDGRELESNPFDIVSDGSDGWIVSDAAANAVLQVSARGDVTVLGVFWPKDSGAPEGVPTGLDSQEFGGRFQYVAFGLFGGGFGVLDVGRKATVPTRPMGKPVVAVAQQVATSSSELATCRLEWEDAKDGGDLICDGKRVRHLDHPTGLALLTATDFVVVEAGQLRRFTKN